MGYFGTVLLTRSDSLIAQLPEVKLIGFRHRHLRELGGGWQLLQTSGWDDPPDLVDAAGQVASAWAAPVLVAHISGGDCAQVHWASPTGVTKSAHLPTPAKVKCGYLHRPAFVVGCSTDEVEADITAWGLAAGLSVARKRLTRVITYSDQVESRHHLTADDQVFELVRALGFPELPSGRAHVVDATYSPFAAIATPFYGLASRARAAAAERNYFADADPEEGWEAEAIQLELDIYDSVYGSDHSLQDLVARVEWVQTAHKAAREGKEPPPREVMVGGQMVTNTARLVEELAESQIANQIKYRNMFGDSHAGTGAWPEMAGS